MQGCWTLHVKGGHEGSVKVEGHWRVWGAESKIWLLVVAAGYSQDL